MPVRDITFLLAKRIFYAGSILAVLSIVLFVTYVLLINKGAGVAGGLLFAAILAIWAIIAVVTLPVMAICQRNLSKNYYRLNYLIALIFALMGIFMCISKGRNLYITVNHWEQLGNLMNTLNLISSVIIGVLAIVASILLLLRNVRTHYILLVMLIVTITMILINIGLHGWRGHFNIVDGIALLPTAITVAAYFFVKRQFTNNENLPAATKTVDGAPALIARKEGAS